MITLRPVSPADIDLVTHHRLMLFTEQGKYKVGLDVMAATFRDWALPLIVNGRYFGYIAEAEGTPVGGIGLMEIDWPPHPTHPTDPRRGYVLNVYVEPEHRGKGIAKQLMQAADSEFGRRGIACVVLHATDAGRPLYEATGWSNGAEMLKLL